MWYLWSYIPSPIILSEAGQRYQFDFGIQHSDRTACRISKRLNAGQF